VRIYPKGCRYFMIAEGAVSTMGYSEQRLLIEHMVPRDGWVVVQPRGRMKWWLFRDDNDSWMRGPAFVAVAREPDSLIMRALLES
jgi:hypothetical protein